MCQACLVNLDLIRALLCVIVQLWSCRKVVSNSRKLSFCLVISHLSTQPTGPDLSANNREYVYLCEQMISASNDIPFHPRHRFGTAALNVLLHLPNLITFRRVNSRNNCVLAAVVLTLGCGGGNRRHFVGKELGANLTAWQPLTCTFAAYQVSFRHQRDR